MEWIGLNVICSLLQTWFVTELLDIKKNMSWFYRIVMVIINVSIVTIYGLTDISDIPLVFILFILNFILAYIFTYNKVSEILFVVMLENMYSLTMNIILLFINELCLLELDVYYTKILYFVLGFFFLKKLKVMRVTLHQTNDYILIVILFGLYCVSSFFTQEYLVLKSNTPELIKIFGILLLCLLSVFILLLYLFDLNNKKEKYEKLKQEFKNEQTLLHIYDQLKMTKHDLKHDYQLIDHYLNQKAYVKIKELINNRKHIITSIPVFVKTKNELINAIINNKMMNADVKGIKVECLINVPQSLPIQDYVLNDLLSNVLDNAIENCPKNGLIRINILFGQPILHIQVINDIDFSFDQTLKTKKDKQNHGYGLKSIRRIVHQYHGEMNIQYDDKSFIIQLSLLLQ